jgi:hypothetical protein
MLTEELIKESGQESCLQDRRARRLGKLLLQESQATDFDRTTEF